MSFSNFSDLLLFFIFYFCVNLDVAAHGARQFDHLRLFTVIRLNLFICKRGPHSSPLEILDHSQHSTVRKPQLFVCQRRPNAEPGVVVVGPVVVIRLSRHDNLVVIDQDSPLGSWTCVISS